MVTKKSFYHWFFLKSWNKISKNHIFLKKALINYDNKSRRSSIAKGIKKTSDSKIKDQLNLLGYNVWI